MITIDNEKIIADELKNKYGIDLYSSDTSGCFCVESVESTYGVTDVPAIITTGIIDVLFSNNLQNESFRFFLFDDFHGYIHCVIKDYGNATSNELCPEHWSEVVTDNNYSGKNIAVNKPTVFCRRKYLDDILEARNIVTNKAKEAKLSEIWGVTIKTARAILTGRIDLDGVE